MKMFNILTDNLDYETQCLHGNLLDNANLLVFDISNSGALIKKDLKKIQDWVERNVKFNKKKSSAGFLRAE